MPLPLLAIARAASVASRVASLGSRAGAGGGGVTGKVTHVEDMTATYLSDARDLVEKACLVGAGLVVGEAKQLLSNRGARIEPWRSPKTGKKRRSLKKPKARYDASDPGDPPNLQTGALRKSIEFEGARTVWGEFIARVGPTGFAAKYGLYLEFGMGMIPRYYLRPALDNKMMEIRSLIHQAMKLTSERKATGRDVMTGRFTSGGG